MNILMMTNTFTPFVGGVSKSVTTFAQACREAGHRVLIVAPHFEGMLASEEDVIRVPAIQHFNGGDFSFALPIPGYLSSRLERFKPDIVHSHHPHLLGNTAVRVASRLDRPLVFTHHTMYEHYLHYVPAGAHRLGEFVIGLVTGYCNLCDHVITPSRSIAAILRSRGVETAIDVVPTGVRLDQFEHGGGRRVRRSHRIPQNAFVAGYVGRLAPEKNLSFLAEAVCSYVARTRGGQFLVVGSGPSEGEIRALFDRRGMAGRLHFAGSLEGQDLADAYQAMDVFVFASHPETQGMVLTEAMAAGKPVVALDAPGVREVVRDRCNGRLLKRQSTAEFATAMARIAFLSPRRRDVLSRAARQTAQRFSIDRCTRRLLRVYEDVLGRYNPRPKDESGWYRAVEGVKAEWELLKNMAEAVGHALR
jgi:1,2-diacylglycerol 3-alpha-glucosyltransferase